MPAWGVFLGKWGFSGSKQPQVLSLREQTEPRRKHEAIPGQKSLLGISDVFLGLSCGKQEKDLGQGRHSLKTPRLGSLWSSLWGWVGFHSWFPFFPLILKKCAEFQEVSEQSSPAKAAEAPHSLIPAFLSFFPDPLGD